MSIKNYLSSNGKISAAMVDGGTSETLEEVLTNGDDAGGLDILNVNQLSTVNIDAIAPAGTLTLGTATNSIVVNATDTILLAPSIGLDINAPVVNFMNAACFDPGVPGPATATLLLKVNGNNYKIPLTLIP